MNIGQWDRCFAACIRTGAFKNFLPRIDDQSITVKPFSDGIDVFSFTGQRSDVGPSEYAPGHLCSLSHCDLKTFYVHWPAAFAIIFHHFPMVSHHFPMISHVILHLHNLHIIFPQTNLPNRLQSHLQVVSLPKLPWRLLPSLRPGPDVLRSFSSTPDVAGASLWVGLSGHGDLATESPGGTSQCLEERPGDGCGEDAVRILVGWYIHRGGYPNNWGYSNTSLDGFLMFISWKILLNYIDDLEVPPFHETSIYDIQLM